jgi:hypothetical protein
MCRKLVEANALVRSLDIILLGIEADANEALSPYRTERSLRDMREGLKFARSSLDQLLIKIGEVPHADAQARDDGT